jgi:hypothetical protein
MKHNNEVIANQSMLLHGIYNYQFENIYQVNVQNLECTYQHFLVNHLYS